MPAVRGGPTVARVAGAWRPAANVVRAAGGGRRSSLPAVPARPCPCGRRRVWVPTDEKSRRPARPGVPRHTRNRPQGNPHACRFRVRSAGLRLDTVAEPPVSPMASLSIALDEVELEEHCLPRRPLVPPTGRSSEAECSALREVRQPSTARFSQLAETPRSSEEFAFFSGVPPASAT
jgi:hypothetical protein